MAENIKWETEIDAALTLARVEKKPVLLDFFGYQLKAGHFPPFWLYGN